MTNTAEQASPVKSKIENPHHFEGVAWGAREIGQIIRRSERSTHHLLTQGQIKCARKVGGRWSAGIPALLREFGA